MLILRNVFDLKHTHSNIIIRQIVLRVKNRAEISRSIISQANNLTSYNIFRYNSIICLLFPMQKWNIISLMWQMLTLELSLWKKMARRKKIELFYAKICFLSETLLAHVARDDINHTVIATYEKYWIFALNYRWFDILFDRERTVFWKLSKWKIRIFSYK